jgi:2'-5' RNA ligase
MQSVCALIPFEYFQRVVDLRAAVCEEPAIGAIYDPPFVHFTLQLAEEYDWEGLAAALESFAAGWKPFELTTIGLLVFTGKITGVAVAPYKDRSLAEYHSAVWETITPFAQGRVDPFYHPVRWVPHITIKRCGSDAGRFGAAMAKLAAEDFHWTMPIENVAVQHDPGKNSLTHYLRLRYPLGDLGPGQAPPTIRTNATIQEVVEGQASDGAPFWTATIRLDEGQELTPQWDATEMVRLMAGAASSSVHFPGARCSVDADGTVSLMVPNSPFPTVAWH